MSLPSSPRPQTFPSAPTGFTLGLLSGAIALLTATPPALAQLGLVPDTAPDRSTNTTVNPLNPQIDIIRGGARPQNGINLFHSFQEFNVGDDRGVYFEAPNGVENIINRVTGADPSDILGTLGVIDPNLNFDDANLILINPNGIIFGPDASLDVSGSFLATTANALELGEGAFFSATDPASSTLLSINPSALFFNAATAQGIVNQSVATQTLTGSSTSGLQAGTGRSLLLIGGDLNLEAGRLRMVGGRIELSAVAGSGRVGLVFDPTQIRAVIPENTPLADIHLSQGATVDLEGATGNIPGRIQLLGDELSLSDESRLFTYASTDKGAEIFVSARTINLQNGSEIATASVSQGDSGDIQLNATEAIALSNASIIGTLATNLTPNATVAADSGSITIATRSLSVQGPPNQASGISTLTFLGRGEAGSLNIQADNITLDNGFLGAASLSAGQGGNINIETQNFTAQNGSSITSITLNPNNLNFSNTNSPFINASTIALFQFLLANTPSEELAQFGQANAGDIRINATHSVLLTTGSTIATGTSGQGRGGDIDISTATLDVLSGTQLSAVTSGEGDAGSVRIRVSDRSRFEGSSADGQRLSAILSNVADTSTGQGGNIEISTGTLEVLNGAQLNASTAGQGDAGSVTINARDRIRFDDSGLAFSTVEESGRGQGGDIEITTDTLEVLNGAQLLASTRGQGNAGSVRINARDRIRFQGNSANTLFPSAALSSVEATANGQGGNIEIRTGTLEVNDGAQLLANTRGRGNAGNVIVNARDAVQLRGVGDGFSSGIFTSNTPNASGRGGDITIHANSIQIADGAVLDARTANRRRGGNITLTSEQFTAVNGGQVIATTLRKGRAGSINLNAEQVLLSGSDATLPARLRQFPDRIANEAEGQSGLFTSTAANSSGQGGAIAIHANTMRIEGDATISAQSQGQGNAGNINITTRDQLTLQNGNIVTAATNSSGGDIQINATQDQTGEIRLGTNGMVLLAGDSDITTNSLGDGGNISVGGTSIIAFDDSDMIASSRNARGGNITLGAFFSETVPVGSAQDFDHNHQVDVNATGRTASGRITTPDTSTVQNSLADLPDNAIDVNQLLANSCIAHTRTGGTFLVTGSGGFPQRPAEGLLTPYPTRDVQPLPPDPQQRWQIGDPIVEPQGLYQLNDGRWVMSRVCR